jgi:hypothetical protein
MVDWSDEERTEFLAIMNAGWLTRHKLTMEQIIQFEIWAESPRSLEPKQQVAALGYMQDKMLRLYGRKALGRVMKVALKRAKDAHDSEPQGESS